MIEEQMVQKQTNPFKNKTTPTLCWDCANAIGKCRWSFELKPVRGWKIIPTKNERYGATYKSCIVIECPEFKRDATDNGLKRYREETKDDA